MARPKVFVSSTFYYLRQIRDDIRRFILEQGYEPILNERGSIPYGKDDKLEESCYREIERHCDLLVAIIGGRFGTASEHAPHSISQVEVKTALKQGKQVYIFIEKGVYSEYRTFQENKDTPNMRYAFVTDRRVYEFIEMLEALPCNNPIHPFETTMDITSILRAQWAGLFQSFLEQQNRQGEWILIDKLEATARTLDELVEYFSKSRDGNEQVIDDIVLSNHPAMEQIQRLLRPGYRVFFTSLGELTQWLKARSYTPVGEANWDEPEIREWICDLDDGSYNTLKIDKSVFSEDGRLRPVSRKEWDPSRIQLQRDMHFDPFADE